MTDISLATVLEARSYGLRMSADEYLALPEDSQYRYELVDGVVFMSPSPTFRHQNITAEISRQIGNFLLLHPLGKVAAEVDVKLSDDLVYRPDAVYLTLAKAERCGDAVTEPPDLIVEIVSPFSRSYDTQTKRGDYEAAGVGEFWLIDPERHAFCFLVLEGGAYREVSTTGERYASTVLSGFEPDLALVRRCF